MAKRFLFSILGVFGLVVNGNCQDTLRTYFDNGQMSSEYPSLGGKSHGLCRMWYSNGQLESTGVFDSGKQVGKQLMWFESGKPKMIWYYSKNGMLKSSHSWHPNGKKATRFRQNKWKTTTKFWYDSGKILMKSVYRNGQPISCTAPTEIADKPVGDSLEICYCGDIRVYWNGNAFVDSLGKERQRHFRMVSKTWFPNGQMQTRDRGKAFGKKNLSEGWNEKGVLIKKERYKNGKPVVSSKAR